MCIYIYLYLLFVIYIYTYMIRIEDGVPHVDGATLLAMPPETAVGSNTDPQHRSGLGVQHHFEMHLS